MGNKIDHIRWSPCAFGSYANDGFLLYGTRIALQFFVMENDARNVTQKIVVKDGIIQLMHSFEVNIRICQPENSDVHRGEAEVNITFEG